MHDWTSYQWFRAESLGRNATQSETVSVNVACADLNMTSIVHDGMTNVYVRTHNKLQFKRA